MGNKEAYDQMLNEAKALKKEEIQTPYMPIGIFTQEAEDLYQWCLKDKEQLMAAGIPETHFLKLNLGAGALRYGQSVWAEDLKTRQEAEQQWAVRSPLAFDLCDQMIHTFRYAYKDEESILTNISAIAEGDGAADMIQDLSDLAVLGENNPEPLKRINFNMALLEECATTSAEMADLRGAANGEKFSTNDNLQIRNQLYTLLKGYVDDIRNCGKYLFWRNADRLKGYRSEYKRNQNN